MIRDKSKEFKASICKRGKVIYDSTYIIDAHVDEVRIARWLASEFGGDIRLLTESNKEGMRTPDYLWKGRFWELKSIHSDKYTTIDTKIRKAYLQIRGNQGGIVLDFTESGLSFSKSKELVEKSISRRIKDDTEVIIKKENEYSIYEVIKE